MLERLNGETRLFPIIGDPIIYAKSPERFTGQFAARGHNGICVPMQVAEADLEPVMRGLRRNADGTWHGDMFDGLAFLKAQIDEGARPLGARVLLVGAGGAGGAIAIALLEAGVRELVIHDRNETRAARLIALLAGLGAGHATSGPPDPTGCDIVCNATPTGMAEGDPLPVAADLLAGSMFVSDVIAGHGVTPLLQAARAVGCRTTDGVQMVEAVQEMMLDFMLGK